MVALNPVVPAAEPEIVHLPAQGKLRGSRSGAIRSFKGIPYARSPGGAFDSVPQIQDRRGPASEMPRSMALPASKTTGTNLIGMTQSQVVKTVCI